VLELLIAIHLRSGLIAAATMTEYCTEFCEFLVAYVRDLSEAYHISVAVLL
jgi:hypothetical protein